MDPNCKSRIDKFKTIVDAIDSPGGHIVICILLGIFGAAVILGGVAITGTDEKSVNLLLRVGEAFLVFLPIAAYAMRGMEKANGKTDPPAPPTPPANPPVQP